jgi:hypothetical protein
MDLVRFFPSRSFAVRIAWWFSDLNPQHASQYLYEKHEDVYVINGLNM